MKRFFIVALGGLILSAETVAQDENEHMFGFGASHTTWDFVSISQTRSGNNTSTTRSDGEKDSGYWLAYRWQHRRGAGITVRADIIGGTTDGNILEVLGHYTFRTPVYVGGGLTAIREFKGTVNFDRTDHYEKLDNMYGVKVVVGGLLRAGVGHVDLVAEYFLGLNDSTRVGNRIVSDGIDGFSIRIGYLF